MALTAPDPAMLAKMAAVKMGSPAEVRAQLTPEDKDWRDGRGCSLLFFAVGREAGTAEEALEICRFLVEELGMDINLMGGVHTLGQTPLFYAASTGFASVSAYLLDKGAAIQMVDLRQQTALFWAAAMGNVATLEVLLARSADPNFKDKCSQSALFYAASMPKRPVNAESQCNCLRALLEKQCAVDSADHIGQSALFYAAKTIPQKVELLLQHRASINLRDQEGQTPLLFSTDARNVDTCRVLLEHRADPHLASKTGVTPFLLLPTRPELSALFRPFQAKSAQPAPRTRPRRAASTGAPAMKRRRRGAPQDGDEAERAAAAEDDDDAASAAGSCVSSVLPGARGVAPPATEELQPKPLELDASALSELSRAVLRGTAAEVESLIAAGHSPRELNTQTGGNLVLVAAMRADGNDSAAKDICSLLVESHKLSPTYIDNQLQTPLIHAAQRGLVECASYLLGARCDPAQRDALGRTPLHHAACLESPGCARALLDVVGEVNVADKAGRTPLAEAAAKGCPKTLSLLLERGAEAGDALTCAAVVCIRPLAEARCDPNSPSSDGRLPLLIAARDGSIDRVAALLEARADVHNREDMTGRTAFHCAVKGKHLPLCKALLTSFDADINAADAGGETPLSCARRLRWSGGKELEAMERQRREQRDEAERAKATMKAQQRHQLAAAVKHGPLEQVRDLLQAAGASFREPLEADPTAPGARSQPPLHAAASRAVPLEQGGALEACRLLIEVGGLDAGERNASGQTALFEAAAAGNTETCEYLAAQPTGGGVDATDADGRTALFNAARCGRPAALTTLLACRANVAQLDKQQQTVLFPAARSTASAVECVELLLAARAQPGALDALGRSSLSYASQDGADAVIRKLAAARASVNAPDQGGRSALFFAIREARVNTARMLLQEFEARPPGQGDRKLKDDGRGNTDLFDMARDRGFPEVVRMLEEASQKHKEHMALWEALLKAAREGSAEELDRLAAQRADVHSADSAGQTPLHLAAARLDELGLECCRRLIEVHKVDVNAANSQQETPLFGTAREGSEAALALLLESRCDPSLQSLQGETALFAAAQGGRETAAAALLRRGVRADHRDGRGQTAIFHAGRPGCAGVLRRLLEEGISSDIVDHQGCTPLFAMEDVECARVLLDRGCNLDAPNNAGRTALFAAAEGDRIGVVQLLLERKASARVVDVQGQTALHCARGAAAPRLLLAASVPPDHLDKNSQTALFFAAVRDDEAMVHALASAGADGALRDVNGQTALFYAAREASLKVVRKLICQAFADPAAVDASGQTASKIAKASPSAKEGVADFLAGLGRLGTSSGRGRGRGGRSGRTGGEAAEHPRRYCLMFDDPSDPTGATKVPFGTPQYEAALSKLAEALPDVFRSVWPADLPLSRGPPEQSGPETGSVGVPAAS